MLREAVLEGADSTARALSDLEQQKGQGRAQLNGEHPSVKLHPGQQFRDKQGCATLPQDTSLEDTEQRGVQRSEQALR